LAGVVGKYLPKLEEEKILIGHPPTDSPRSGKTNNNKTWRQHDHNHKFVSITFDFKV